VAGLAADRPTIRFLGEFGATVPDETRPTMTPRSRRRAQPRVSDEMEPRRLLAAPVVPGNVGQLVASQFQPFGFKATVGTQLRDVSLRGPLRIDVVSPFPAPVVDQSPIDPPINSGLIRHSQFNGGGFRAVGLQLRRVRLGRGLTVSGFDDEDPGVGAFGVGAALSGTPPALINRGLISNSQFSDGGFGVLERTPDGRVIAREGRVGLQWHQTRVRGPVDIGLANLVIQPGAEGPGPAVPTSATPAVADPGTTVVDLRTNIGRIRGSQFNDGGFGDIGMQWSGVAVGGRVGTTTNTLFLRPRQDDLGPITIEDLDFGRRAAGATTHQPPGVAAGAPARQAARLAPRAKAGDPPFRTTYTNSTTNSGRLVHAQFNDGGFGDVGLQWRKVRVGGSVTAAHNSLTVQPENRGQGLITVKGIRFPVTPPAPPRPAPRRPRVLPPDPPVIARDGDPVARELPAPTGPLSPFFTVPFDGAGTVTIPFPGDFPLVNAASNSGLIQGGQFSAGGFGDQGLQWQSVGVRGDVELVHNSLSVHPEGSMLEGINVSGVSYGAPVSPRAARRLAVLPFAEISPGALTGGEGTGARAGRVLSPPNDRWLTDQQLAPSSGTDVFLQWNGIVRRRGLVLVHNIIKISGVGPETGPITLRNIRFPYRVPPLAPLGFPPVPPTGSVGAEPREAVLLNTANNSGILGHAQFSDGGFGDDALQWRRVHVGGSVAVVHNTLAVDETADLPPGDVPGPLTISDVTFNSGALDGRLPRRRDQVLVSPPDAFRRVSSRPVDLGRPLPRRPGIRDESTNSGIMAGGQLASGAANHVLLQWQCVNARGKVTVIDNVLSISVLDRPSGPITISDVTFA
jgi:hypothetical protein